METTQGSTLSSRMREAVRSGHERIERLPYFVALASRSLPLERYVDQLRAMAIVEATLDRAVRTADHPAIVSARDACPSRLEALLADLASFDRRGPLPDDPSSAAPALSLSRAILLLSAERPAALLGPLYVSRGMALGNLVHYEDARACSGGGGASWYAGHGSETGPLFRRFCAVLDELDLAEDDAAAAVAAAVDSIEALERVHAALDPAARPSRRFLATTLNPEAGSHEVPGDPAVLAAALRAGERCLHEIPYFLERYGERGRRFTGSDAAWLASLNGLPTADASDQVAWLASVLSRKGMPSLLLERQLLLLDGELRASGLGREGSALGRAARDLADRRNAALPEPIASGLAAVFVASCGHGREEARLEAAGILLAAVADEATGLAGTVKAVSEWYRSSRFPDSWNGAVDVLLRDALAATVVSGGREGSGG
ncbi:MAG: biliverdin-producing heme oxygenase [Thermoanaerobaculia bacterium]